MFFKFCRIKEAPEQLVEQWKSQTILFSFFASIIDDNTVTTDFEISEKLNTFINWYDWGMIGLNKGYFIGFIEENRSEAFTYFKNNRNKGEVALTFCPEELKVIIDNAPAVKDYLTRRKMNPRGSGVSSK